MSFIGSFLGGIKNAIVWFFYPFKWFKIPVITVFLYLLVSPVIMLLNYSFPAFFEVGKADGKPGYVFTSTLIQIGEEMLNPWLPNDIIYPTIFLDNPQNFQLGELEMLRNTVRVLRDNLARLRTTDAIDENCDAAFVAFSNDPKRWIFPSPENRFGKAIDELKKYRNNLENGSATFYPRVDNLIQLLEEFNSRLGGINSQLARAPRDQAFALSEETAGDPYLQGEKALQASIPWRRIDDNFYSARGVVYVLRQMMLATRYEFREVLEFKKSVELVDRIIELLDLCQFEPIYVANGGRSSFWPNHSLALLATTEDVRQKIGSLLSVLEN
jgi:hypothetical protein